MKLKILKLNLPSKDQGHNSRNNLMNSPMPTPVPPESPAPHHKPNPKDSNESGFDELDVEGLFACW